MLTAVILSAALALGESQEQVPPAEPQQQPQAAVSEVSARVDATVQPLVSAFVVFSDDESGNFDVDDWLDALATKQSGIYVKNAQAFVVSRISGTDEPQAFQSIKAKANAIRILREHYPDLPGKIENMAMRNRAILDDGVILSVSLAEIENLMKTPSNPD